MHLMFFGNGGIQNDTVLLIFGMNTGCRKKLSKMPMRNELTVDARRRAGKKNGEMEIT